MHTPSQFTLGAATVSLFQIGALQVRLAEWLESQGATLYCVGDLFHHQVEVERPEWGVSWADPATTARSRAALLTAAQAEQALLIAAHIQGVGRLARDGAGVHWGQLELGSSEVV